MPDKEEQKKPDEPDYTTKMADKPVVAPDGHVNLTQEDIDARKGKNAKS